MHSTLKNSPWAVVFRQEKRINWLIVEERYREKGVECEDDTFITEESLAKELEGETDAEVLAGFRVPDLDLRLLAAASTSKAKVGTSTQESPAKSTLRAPRVVPLPAAFNKPASTFILHFTSSQTPHLIYPP